MLEYGLAFFARLNLCRVKIPIQPVTRFYLPRIHIQLPLYICKNVKFHKILTNKSTNTVVSNACLRYAIVPLSATQDQNKIKAGTSTQDWTGTYPIQFSDRIGLESVPCKHSQNAGVDYSKLDHVESGGVNLFCARRENIYMYCMYLPFTILIQKLVSLFQLARVLRGDLLDEYSLLKAHLLLFQSCYRGIFPQPPVRLLGLGTLFCDVTLSGHVQGKVHTCHGSWERQQVRMGYLLSFCVQGGGILTKFFFFSVCLCP